MNEPLDAIIISDLHLGATNCQAKLLQAFLQQIHAGTIPTLRLILNGDVFDSLDSRLTKWHWSILSEIRKISDHVEVIYVAGNHDRMGHASVVAHLLGATYYDKEYCFSSGTHHVLCLHGDAYDQFISQHPWLTWVADLVYCGLQWLDPSCYFAQLAKRSSKSYLRCADRVRQGAVAHAKKRHCTVVCAGHTHHAVIIGNYCNSGCWTELPCSYLTVRDGQVKLHNVS